MEPSAIPTGSEQNHLLILQFPDQLIKSWDYRSNLRQQSGIMENCELMNTESGELQFGEKRIFGYHIAAYLKYGRQQLQQINPQMSSNSFDPDSLDISHLCGTATCINMDHLVIEPYESKIQRQHCHYVMNSVLERFGLERLKDFHECQICPHEPKCGKLNE